MRRMILAGLLMLTPAVACAQDIQPLVAKIKAVGAEGKGGAEAAAAWKQLAERGPEVLLDILAAIDDASPLAANYLRSAVEAIADRALAAKTPLPADKLEAFVKDTKHGGAARRLAYEYLVKLDPMAPNRLLPTMLDDPSKELRRDAVALLIDQARLYRDKEEAAQALRKALTHGRDRDQLETIAKQLGQHGHAIDLTKHFGFLTRWSVIGPFDNTDGIGFKTVFAPELGVDLKKTVDGKNGKPAAWKDHTTSAKYGIVDLNKVVVKAKGVVAYAYTVVVSETEQPVELRCGSENAVVIYLNGKSIYSREEYHSGFWMDQHVGAGVLKKGANEILVKVLQDENTADWAARWSFQLRVCDALGAAVPLTMEIQR